MKNALDEKLRIVNINDYKNNKSLRIIHIIEKRRQFSHMY